MPALHADLGGPELDRLVDPGGEVVLGDRVRVGRALALAEAAEGATDDTDVGEVDVAVDDERRGVTRELRPELVGGGTHLLNDLRPGLGEQRLELVLGERNPLAALGDRRRRQVRIHDAVGAATRPPPRDEAPVLQLHDVQHALLHPFRIEVLRVHAEALGEGDPLRRKTLADLMRTREGVLGRDVVAVGREAAEVGRSGGYKLVPPVGQVRWDLDPDVRHQALRLGDQPLHVVEASRPRPRSGIASSLESGEPSPAQRSRAASSAMSATSRP